MVLKGALESSGWAFLRGQRRMLVTTIIGYTLFCFLRKNLSLAMPGLAHDCGVGYCLEVLNRFERIVFEGVR